MLTAESGEEAVRLAMQEAPDLIFTEARLPIVDGWRLIEVLRAEPEFGRVPFVLLTAWVEPRQAQRARAAGFDAYLPKPVVPGCILREARRLIGPARAAVAERKKPAPRRGRSHEARPGAC